MKFINDRALKEMNADLFNKFGVNGLTAKIDELEKRLEALEKKPKVGRPKKVVNA